MADSSGNMNHALDCSHLPNPFTPMAFIPPHVASEVQFFSFITVCSLAILIWDQLHTLSDEYQLAFKNRVRWSTTVYFISRIFTLVFIIGDAVQITYVPSLRSDKLDPCKPWTILLNTCFLLSRASTTFLMYFRVCAVAAIPFGAVKIQHTKHYNIGRYFVVAMIIADFINDTLILLAIVYKLRMADIRRSPAPHISTVWKPMHNLQSFTKFFLQDSQIYYAIAVALNLFTIITFLVIEISPLAPFPIKVVFAQTIIVHIMACRVFRNIKLGRHSQTLVTPTPVNPGDLERHCKCEPRLGEGEENSHHMGDTNMSGMLTGFSPQAEPPFLPITNTHESGVEKPSAQLRRAESTKVTELTPCCP